MNLITLFLAETADVMC